MPVVLPLNQCFLVDGRIIAAVIHEEAQQCRINLAAPRLRGRSSNLTIALRGDGGRDRRSQIALMLGQQNFTLSFIQSRPVHN